jgi:hypothetical protein
MMQTVKDAFSSKKFLAFLGALIVYVAGRWGFNVDPAALDRVLALTGAYLGAQGLADIGKSAAVVSAAAGSAPATAAIPAPPAALARGLAPLLVILAIGGAVMAPACGGSQTSRASTISSLDTGIQTATAALRTYEHEHAEAIIEAAADKPAAKAAIAAFRAKVDKVWIVVDSARAAIDAANTINDDTSVKGAQTALNNAIAAITAITGGTP